MINQPFQGGDWVEQFVASVSNRSRAEAIEEEKEIRARQQNTIILHRSKLLVWASNMCLDVLPTLICWEQYTFILYPACVQYLIHQQPPDVALEMLHAYRRQILSAISLIQRKYIHAIHMLLSIVKLVVDLVCSLI